MVGRHVDAENLKLEKSPEPSERLTAVAEGVTVVVTQAYGPKGDSLVGLSEVKFNGYPALTLLLRTPDGREGQVHLSPIHGDKRKEGFTDIAPGTRLTLLCPVSRQPLHKLGSADDGSGADYYAIYLSSKLSPSNVVMVTDVWDHYHSRIVDDNELISYWAVTHSK